jgi:ADP-ribosylation factor-like protein 4
MGAGFGKQPGAGSSLLSLNSPVHIVMLGLDSAGKTTALYRLKFDQYLNTVPTIGFNCEKVKVRSGRIKGHTFLVWDIGGQDKLRPLWRSYTRRTDGIVFVVDSVDEERLEEAKVELIRTVKQPDNANIPVLVLANKQDLPGAKDPAELARILGLSELSQGQWHVQPACAIIGDGLADGLEKLYDMIVTRKKLAKNKRKKPDHRSFLSSTSSSHSAGTSRR